MQSIPAGIPTPGHFESWLKMFPDFPVIGLLAVLFTLFWWKIAGPWLKADREMRAKEREQLADISKQQAISAESIKEGIAMARDTAETCKATADTCAAATVAARETAAILIRAIDRAAEIAKR